MPASAQGLAVQRAAVEAAAGVGCFFPWQGWPHCCMPTCRHRRWLRRAGKLAAADPKTAGLCSRLFNECYGACQGRRTAISAVAGGGRARPCLHNTGMPARVQHGQESLTAPSALLHSHHNNAQTCWKGCSRRWWRCRQSCATCTGGFQVHASPLFGRAGSWDRREEGRGCGRSHNGRAAGVRQRHGAAGMGLRWCALCTRAYTGIPKRVRPSMRCTPPALRLAGAW